MSTTTETTAPLGEPTLHHLNHSQSLRVLWLLEELAIPYKVEFYERHTSGPKQSRAPDSLKAVHPLGKSPVLVTGDGITISESTTIIAYLIKTYDTTGKFSGNKNDPNTWIRNDSLSSFAGNSMGSVGIIRLLLDIMEKQTPGLLRPLVKLLTKGIDSKFTGPEVANSLTYLQNQLGKDDYFMGSEPGMADFVLSWPLDMIAQRKWADLSKYPALQAWHNRCQARPAYKAALEKGNGYDLNSF